MYTVTDIIHELQYEAKVTRKYLEVVPFENGDFKPHKHSETLARLAIHTAEIVAWWKSVIETEQLDFSNFHPKNITNNKSLLMYFDSLLAEAIQSLYKFENKPIVGKWSMMHGNEELFTLPKIQVLRSFCMNHFIHHRAQLGVYLRLLDVDIPATYGPSFSNEEVLLITPWE